MTIFRREFLTYSVASGALALWGSLLGKLENAFASGEGVIETVRHRLRKPSYPIAADAPTTVDRTVTPAPLPAGTKVLRPHQVSQYARHHYGEWNGDGAGYGFVRPDLQTGAIEPSVPDPAATPLLSFFTISDVHIVDKESPAQCLFLGYDYPSPVTPEGQPTGNSSAYSPVILYSTHVLDAAVQTINALHKATPFDFGLALGDAANNTQYNELRWYIDVLDGKMIAPSSGAHHGARRIDYQKPYQAAGLDHSIPWYQVIGNHDQFWMGTTAVSDHLRNIYTGARILNTGAITSLPPDWSEVFGSRGFYMGVVDGQTKFGRIIDAGPAERFPTRPTIVADPKRRSLTVAEWMTEFFNTTSNPSGHGFTQQMIDDGFACYHFYPRADVPLKVIVVDDTDKTGCGPAGALDNKRYAWLVQELDEGEAAGELMIICAHIPIRPYAAPVAPGEPAPAGNPLYPLQSLWAPYAEVSEETLLAKLHTYKNLILWCAGHVHRNTITPQPSPDGDPEKGFWEVETSSLRDFPQQFRRFDIVLNGDNTLSIFARDVDVAVNPAPLANGSPSPAWRSRSYAIAAQQIFKTQVEQGPHVDPVSGVYNAELVKHLTPQMQAKLARR